MFPAADGGAGAGEEAEVPVQEQGQGHERIETTGGMIVDYFQRTFWSGGGTADGSGAREGERS